MAYGYAFTDPTDIRLVLLLTLSISKKALSSAQITEIVLNNTAINYFDLEEQLMDLVSLNEVIKEETSEKREIYSLSEEGENTIRFFYKKVPFSVREQIKISVQQMQRQADIKPKIGIDIVPVSFDEYALHCIFSENGLTLMDITLYAGTQEAAKQMAAHFKSRPEEIYHTALSAFINNTISH